MGVSPYDKSVCYEERIPDDSQESSVVDAHYDRTHDQSSIDKNNDNQLNLYNPFKEFNIQDNDYQNLSLLQEHQLLKQTRTREAIRRDAILLQNPIDQESGQKKVIFKLELAIQMYGQDKEYTDLTYNPILIKNNIIKNDIQEFFKKRLKNKALLSQLIRKGKYISQEFGEIK